MRLLGPVDVLVDSVSRPVRGLRRKAVLAVLGLHRGQIVSTDRLVDAVWGAAAPSTSVNTVQSHVSHLRRVLGSKSAIRARPPGYLLDLGADGTDVEVAERLIRQGTQATDPHDRAHHLRAALALWRGRPLVDVAGLPWLDEQAERLDRLWLQAKLAMVETRLALGEHIQLVADLERLTSDHPFDEQIHGQLMLALYRAGRQADALAVYQRLRRTLGEDLGIDPSQLLRDLEAAVLRQDPALGLPPSSTTLSPAPEAAPVPAQLPPAVSAFAGRSSELAVLDSALEPIDGPALELVPSGTVLAGVSRPAAVVISAVSGTAGVGKTALAVHWAHRVSARFPDGQLYVNLRGYDPEAPMTAGDALAGFLGALGVAGADVPMDVDERAARYRTAVAGRRMLIVLDNAATVEQVRPLLPGTPGAMVVVTSRDSLAGLVALHGARRLDLDLLPSADAVALLRDLVGARVDAEPGAAAALAAQCARLPLALRVAAELAVGRPAAPLAELVAELADQQRRLDLLDAGGDPRAAVRAVFSWSVRHLPAPAALAFRLLGLHPGPDTDAYAAAALTGTDLDQAGRTLHLLARAHLIHPTGAGRYGMHDLLRAYATGLATDQHTEPERRAALGRLFDYYLAAAAAAVDRMHPAEAGSRPRIAPPGTPIPDLADAEVALAWLDVERASMVAVAGYTAAHGWPEHTVRLAATLYRYLAGGYPTDALAIHGHARNAARHAADPAAEAQALTGLGVVHGQLGRHEQAAGSFEEALALFERAGDRVGQARALGNLGTVQERLGRYGPAAEHLRQALALFREAGDEVGEARALTGLGTVETRLGRFGAAVEHHYHALALFRRAGDRSGEARALTSLGTVETRLGRHRPAADHHRQALALYRQAGNRYGQAWALDSLGAVHNHLGRPDQATEHHQQALTLFRRTGDRDGEPSALNGLGEAALAAGHPTDAIAWHTEALATARGTGARDQQARAHAGIGHAHRALAETAAAREHLQHALALYTELGAPETNEIRAHVATLEQLPQPRRSPTGPPARMAPGASR